MSLEDKPAEGHSRINVTDKLVPRDKKRPLGYFTRQQGSYKRAKSPVYHSENRSV